MEAMKVISKTKNYLVAEDYEGSWIAFTSLKEETFKETFFNEIVFSKIQDIVEGRCGCTAETLQKHICITETKVSNTLVVLVTDVTMASIQ